METSREQQALKLSIAATVLIGLVGIASGLLTRSAAIIFDGMYSFVDVVLTLGSLSVSRLLAREDSRRFQYGYWHLEPMVTALGGAILTLACIYAVLNAVRDLMGGGHDVAYGPAAAWAGVLCATGLLMAAWMYRRARRLESSLLLLDAKSWMVSGCLSLALLVGFLLASALQGTALEPWIPYVDGIALLCIGTAMLPVPVATTWRAMNEVLLVAPDELDQQVQAVMDGIVAEQGFIDYSSHVAKIGRTRFVEIHVLVAPETRIVTATADAIRREVAARLDAFWPHFWLTVDFTADREWL
jgi:cation diffusion facilitator family transporter